MSLLKLSSQREDANSLAEQKASEILLRIPSQSLISDAYLFGSAVNGVLTPDSDLDILLVVKEDSSIKKLQSEIYQPHFADIAIDWIIKTEKDFRSRKDLGGVCFEAFHHGKKLR